MEPSNWIAVFVLAVFIFAGTYANRKVKQAQSNNEERFKFAVQEDLEFSPYLFHWGDNTSKDLSQVAKAFCTRIPAKDISSYEPFLGQNYFHGKVCGLPFDACVIESRIIGSAENPPSFRLIVTLEMPVNFPFVTITLGRAGEVHPSLKFDSTDFNRDFHVLSENTEFAHSLLHPQIIELLIRHRPKRLVIGQNCIAMIREGDTVDLEFIRCAKELFRELWVLIPGFLIEDYTRPLASN